jgi:hypothetical protein
MKYTTMCIYLFFSLISVPVVSFAQPPADHDARVQAANTDLDVLARELAKLCATPGFRGFLRSEIARSKNREGILPLEKFLERASRRPDAPPGLAKYRDFTAKARGRLKASGQSQLEGYDLYIPVEAHRAKWKGGKDFVVAFAPVGDDQSVRQIVAYSVSDGQRVLLDAATPPETVVLAIVPEEHESHEASPEQPPREPVDRTLPKPDFAGKEAPRKPVRQEPGNSYVGLRRMYIRDMKEPWWLGSPEIKVMFAQRKGNYCEDKDVTQYSSALEYFDHPRTWRTTWYPDSNTTPNKDQCNNRLKRTCWHFDSRYDDKMRLYIYERDAFGYSMPILYTIAPGVTCDIYRTSEDDYIDAGTMYRDNFPFEYDYRQDMGNAYVYWHKVH